MKRLGIDFADNDFHRTFKQLMNLILEAYADDPEWVEGLTKTQVVLICNELVPAIYFLFQTRDLDNIKNRNCIKEYLTLKEEYILFDQEVDTYISTEWKHNYHFHWVDFDILQTFCI